MNKFLSVLLMFICAGLNALDKSTETPTKQRYGADIEKFVANDKVQPPPAHALLIVGSSSARLWITAAEDFKPYPVINRGFGGSKTTDVLSTMDQIALPYHPRLVIYFAGTNDLGGGAKAEEVLNNIKLFVDGIRKENPKTGVVIMAALKSPKRKPVWTEFDKFNALLKKYCAAGKNLYYVDHNAVMNKPSGEPITTLYREEGDNAMHASSAGYVEITKLVRPIVDQAWKVSDPKTK